MKISKTMLKHYLSYLTVGHFGDHAHPAEDFADYAPIVRNIQVLAQASGDLHWLKRGLEHLLITDGLRLKEYDGGYYPYSPEQIREHLVFLWRALSPGEELPDPADAPAVELVAMSAEDWLDYRQRMTGA